MLENPELSSGREKIFTELGLDNVIVAKNSVTEGVKEHAPYEGIFIQLAVDYFPEEFKNSRRSINSVLMALIADSRRSFGVTKCFAG